jgi:V-type H+-transporting ATPase subunit a
MQNLVSHPVNKHLDNTSVLEVYRTFLQKEKALYSNLNKFKQEEKLYMGFCWIPTIDNEEVLMRINQLKSKDHNIETPTLLKVSEHNVKPPTLLRQNDVTYVFQEIVNTYGVPNYKEVNPSVFAIVTFPFLFGIMFGDIGHGFVLFLVGAMLCLFEEPLRARGMEGVLQMRYLALLMGLFATFAGLIYNDLMAIPVWIWDSCYDIQEIHVKHAAPGEKEAAHMRIPFKTTFKPDCVYPVGIDPTWHLGSNELAYLNSLKMKISVILGVLQMGMGVFMKALNAIYRKNSVDFWFEFVPQIVLLFSLFGFMDWMIIAKWTADFTHREYMAPSIISTMIDMFLGLGAIPEGISPIIGSAGMQQGLSILFLILSLVCSILMLVPKPMILIKEMQEHERHALNDDLHNKSSK